MVSFTQFSLLKPFIRLFSHPYVLRVPPIKYFSILPPEKCGEQYRSLSTSLCSFLHSPVTSSLLYSNIHLSTLFSNTLSLRSSLNVSDQVTHPYKTIGKIIILYRIIASISWHQSALNFFLHHCLPNLQISLLVALHKACYNNHTAYSLPTQCITFHCATCDFLPYTRLICLKVLYIFFSLRYQRNLYM